MHYEVLFVVYLYYFLVTNLLELPVVLLWSRLAFDKPLKRASLGWDSLSGSDASVFCGAAVCGHRDHGGVRSLLASLFAGA